MLSDHQKKGGHLPILSSYPPRQCDGLECFPDVMGYESYDGPKPISKGSPLEKGVDNKCDPPGGEFTQQNPTHTRSNSSTTSPTSRNSCIHSLYSSISSIFSNIQIPYSFFTQSKVPDPMRVKESMYGIRRIKHPPASYGLIPAYLDRQGSSLLPGVFHRRENRALYMGPILRFIAL